MLHANKVNWHLNGIGSKNSKKIRKTRNTMEDMPCLTISAKGGQLFSVNKNFRKIRIKEKKELVF